MAKIKVEQREGDITVAYAGSPDSAKTYNVTGGEVTVAAADVIGFLSAVSGSSPSDAKAKEAAIPAHDPAAPAISPTS